VKKLSDFLRDLPPRAQAIAMDIFPEVAQEAHRSVQEGSQITGAPGQPVDTGNLRASWQLEFPSPTRARISTNVEYAEAVEDGVGPHGAVLYGAKNGTGGSHSVKLTILGLQAIANTVASRRAAGA
jgi:hypothetical protein